MKNAYIRSLQIGKKYYFDYRKPFFGEVIYIGYLEGKYWFKFNNGFRVCTTNCINDYLKNVYEIGD